MGFLNPQSGQRNRCMLMIKVFAVQWVGLLACLANTALAQLEVGEAVTASASLPEAAITCVVNLAVFFSCLLRGRLHVEMGAGDLLATLTAPKLRKDGSVLRTSCRFPHVVMLSSRTPESSMMQFMEYTSNTNCVHSLSLQVHPHNVTPDDCYRHKCRCIEIEVPNYTYINILASAMPGALKRLPNSQYLLPCKTCLTEGCHGCNQSMMYGTVEVFEGMEVEEDKLIVVSNDTIQPEGDPKEWYVHDLVSRICEERICICIPTGPAGLDRWTEMLIRCLKTKDKEDRRVRNPASEALEKDIAQSGGFMARSTRFPAEEYSTVSLILPRVAEIVINVILTAWFRIDGFSSSLVARRVIRDYVVDSRGTGIAANVFLKKCQVYSNSENTNVCVLTFRGNLLNFRTFSFIIGGVNLMCSISWAVLIAIPGNWYDTLSMPPSKARIVILIAAIGIALLMDCLQFYLYSCEVIDEVHSDRKLLTIFLLVVILEIVWIIVGSAVVATLGIKGFGKWTYSAIQVLVWVKWGFGSYSLGAYSYDKDKQLASWAFDVSAGHGLMCASAFLLNAVLAGVRGRWKYSQSGS